jgi:hypothetical protein
MALMSSATYLGCFKDDGNRAMPEGPGPAGRTYAYTPSSCSDRCSNYKFFAVQYYGADCWCSNNLVDATRYGYSTCPGGTDTGLGGSWSNAIFAQQKIFVGVNTLVNYDAAKAACENGAALTLSGGQLATWGSVEEYAKLVGIRNGMSKDAYIGLNDITQEGKWRFIDGDTSYCDDFDGTDCDNIPQWSPGEPNDLGSEDVAEILSNGKLNDIGHADNNAYICEFRAFVSDYTVRSGEIGSGPVNTPNYYVFQFASIKEMVVIISLLLSVVLFACLCYTNVKAFRGKSAAYSKVQMYATEDEKLKL